MSNDNQHILGNFQSALDDLNALMFRMASLAQANLDAAAHGLMNRDSSACASVIADDEEIDRLEKKIDEEGLKIITLYQPVASDLRLVASIMKVSPNLERIGDQSVGIAKRARKMNNNEELAETRLIEPLYTRWLQTCYNSPLRLLRQGMLTLPLKSNNRIKNSMKPRRNWRRN